ncbi:OpgC domain-containing protein [Vibrio scophthalmi]|nr:OpgC domain-containing protein [Vibrio scophthalmi]
MMKRIPALDSIRGLLLLIMTLNHLFWISGGSSIFQAFTLQPLGQFGAAEGFILVSGFLAGAIYSRPTQRINEVKRKAWRRAWEIYRYHIVCLLTVFTWFGFCVIYFPQAAEALSPNFSNLVEAPFLTVFWSLLLVNKPSYLEILPLYIMYIAILPALVCAYRRGWMKGVMAVSFSLWLAAGYLNDAGLVGLLSSSSTEFKLQTGYFDPFAWQLLFVVASAFGFAANNPDFHWYSLPLTLVCGVLAVLIMTMHHGAFLSFGIHQGVLYSLADKPELGWLRALNIALWAYLIAVLIRFRPTWLVFRPLSYIGRHSLQVFAWHTVMIYLMAPMLMSQRFEGHYELLVIICAASIWIPAWMREKRATLSAKTRLCMGFGGAVSVVLLLSLLFQPQVLPEAEADGDGVAPLSVTIKNIQDSGLVIVLVYAEEDDLMGMPSIHAQGYSVEQVEQGITIQGLPVGKYAIFAYQDVDSNQQLTSGVNGMPVEGFGYSNNPALQGPPKMAQVQFSHPEKAHQTIHLVNF